jgi:lipopolysaccharide heptosyltransferase II
METMPFPAPPYHRIVIIKPGAVGDLLQMTPVIRALNRRYPDASITMMVGAESAATLFRNDPRIFRVIVHDRTRTSIFRIWKIMHQGSFDLALNFQRSNIRTWFLVTAALPCRVLVYRKERRRRIHAAVNYLETLAPLGISATDLQLELVLDDASREFARDLFATEGMDDRPVVALNPGATHAVNRWPADRFAELADLITKSLPAKVLVIGGPDDVSLADEIVVRSRSKPPSIAGRTSLLQLGAVLERCCLLVSGDTGPLHMATAVGTKVIALFGAADPERTGPLGTGHRIVRAPSVACVPCRSRDCSNPVYRECMEKITASMVLSALSEMLPSRS